MVPGSHLAATLEGINAVATLVFVAEMLLKMTALGVATTSRSYLSSGWNRLDCFIVTSSLLTIVLGPAVGVLRALRARVPRLRKKVRDRVSRARRAPGELSPHLSLLTSLGACAARAARAAAAAAHLKVRRHARRDHAHVQDHAQGVLDP